MRPRRPEVMACVTAARVLGLDLLREPADRHLWVPPHAGGRIPPGVVAHRSRPIAPGLGAIESIPDLLDHAAHCLPFLEALVVWESALRHRRITTAELAAIPWRATASRRLAATAGDQSDSLLETIARHRLRELGVPLRQQVPLLGHRVDFLLGERLVLQTDGFRHHTAGQRRRDLEHDALLVLHGYRVLRFGYGDVMDRWEHVAGLVSRTLALG